VLLFPLNQFIIARIPKLAPIVDCSLSSKSFPKRVLILLVLPLPSGPTNVILKVRDGAKPNADCLAYSWTNLLLTLTSNFSPDTNNPLNLEQENNRLLLNNPSVLPSTLSSYVHTINN